MAQVAGEVALAMRRGASRNGLALVLLESYRTLARLAYLSRGERSPASP